MLAFCIVTPTLNAGHLLDETARSVIRCLRTTDRYIIVDGGSTDGSIEAVKAWAPPNVYFTKDRGGGMYDAIAKGFENCQEPLMAWLNASDIYLDGALDWVRAEFNRTNADLLHFDDLYADTNSRVICRSVGTLKNIHSAMMAGWTPLQDGCFWRSHLYTACGGISTHWKLAGDFDFFCRAFATGSSAYGRGVVSAFRKHEGQLSRSRTNSYANERQQIIKLLQTQANMETSAKFSQLLMRISLSFRYRCQLMRKRTPYVNNDARTIGAFL